MKKSNFQKIVSVCVRVSVCMFVCPVSYTHLDVYKRQILNVNEMWTSLCAKSEVPACLNFESVAKETTALGIINLLPSYST